MQLSAANLLLAAQQFAKQAPQAATPQFAAALVKEQPKDGFAPMDFKQTAVALPSRPTSQPTAPPRLGATIDIRV